MHSESQWVKREGLFLECSVGYLELRRLNLKYTGNLLLFATDHQRPQAVQILITTGGG